MEPPTYLAKLNPHWEILCVDFSYNLLEKANGTTNMM